MKFIRPRSSRFLVSQSQEWSCSACAFATVLRYRGYRTTEKDAIRMMVRLGFRDFKDGVSIAHLATGAQKLGLQTALLLSWSRISRFRRRAVESVFRGRVQIRQPQENIQAGLKIYIREGGTLYLASGKGPSSSILEAVVRGGGQAIAIVRDAKYYGLKNHQWTHAVAIVPGARKNTAYVLDPFDSLGAKEFKGWKRFARTADNFAWKLWNGDLLLFP